MLTRIRNAQAAEKVSVEIPYSTVKESIIKVLLEEGYISGYNIAEIDSVKRNLVVDLKYFDDKPVIESIKRVSKPSLRVYRDKDNLPMVLGGLGIAVISTSQGMMSDHKARSLSLGGEVICTVA